MADATDLQSLPQLVTKKKWTKKIRPGVSTFGERPTDVGPEHLKELLEHALEVVPKHQIPDTPIFLMATAGVRLLPKPQQTALLSEICAYARKRTDFSLPDCDLHIQVIPGDTEGLYGWIAANYLLGGFGLSKEHDHGKGHHTYGFLDMGGASAQIAFAPNRTEAIKHANDLTLLRMRTIDGQPLEYRVFTTTWLGFGVNQARQRYVEALKEETYEEEHRELLDPCLPKGLSTTVDGSVISKGKSMDATKPVLKGTGMFDECIRKTYPLLDKDAPCEDKPCLLHGQHVPAIDFDVNHFVGVSEYWHTTHEVFNMSDEGTVYNFKKYQSLVQEFCGQDWSKIQDGLDHEKWGKNVKEKTAREACFKASWLINVLHDGLGIPRIGLETGGAGGYNASHEVHESHPGRTGFLDPFKAIDKIDGTEVSWTLGKMLLFAAGQVPPSSDSALPVGFGSNVADVPADFQYAGSSSHFVPIGGDEEDWSETADEVFEHGSSSSVIILLVLLVVISYIFRKRDTRNRFFQSASSLVRRNRRPGSPKKAGRGMFSTAGNFFGAHTTRGSYDRIGVLEDGTLNDYELGDVDTDDTDGSDAGEGPRANCGLTSGLATPTTSSVAYDGFFDRTTRCLRGDGVVVRTESRERLSLGNLNCGRRSRAASPSRSKSTMSPLEE